MRRKGIGKTALAIIMMAFMMMFASLIGLQAFLIISQKTTQVDVCTLTLDIQNLRHDKGERINITEIVENVDNKIQSNYIVTKPAKEFVEDQIRFFDKSYDEIAMDMSVITFIVANNNNVSTLNDISISVFYNLTPSNNVFNISVVDTIGPLGRKGVRILMKDNKESPAYIATFSTPCPRKIPTIVLFLTLSR